MSQQDKASRNENLIKVVIFVVYCLAHKQDPSKSLCCCVTLTYINFFVRVIEHSNQKVQCNQHGSEAINSKQKLSCDLSDLCVLEFESRKLNMSEQCPKQDI